MKKLGHLLTLLLLAVLGLAACDANAGGADRDGSPAAGGTLRVAFWDDAQRCADPNQVYWIETRSVNRQVADSLTDQDPATGAIVPWLATDWTVSGDAREYTFNLRGGVTFSDGAPLDAAAVKTALDATVALGAKSVLGLTYLAGYASATVVDPDTVTVRFNQPNAAFLQATSTTTLAILSPATYRETPERRCAGRIAGSGPFVMDEFTAGTRVHLTRRKDYAWPSSLVRNRGAAHLDAITFSYIKEDSVRVGSLTSGAIDVAWPREPISEPDQKLIRATGGRVESRPLPGVSYQLVPNVTDGRPLADRRVRQALQKLIDRRTYADTIYWPGYPVVAGVFDSTTPYFAPQAPALAHDPDGAGRLLDEAGWRREPDGYRYRDGRRLSLVDPVTAALPGDQLLQDQLRQAGIDLQLRVVTAAQRVDMFAAGDFDLALAFLTRADPSVLGSALDQAVSRQGTARYSQDAGTGERISALFAQGLRAIDPAQRGRAYADLQRYVVEQAVSFPICERVQAVGLSRRVQGFAFTSESFLRANDVWLSGADG
ncbi:ABC transporter substrate-binding protein [Actinoplanes philippinensis]|uniref:Peptide/nickel transport system substrate-binding protein n=1 Tax=Actinoplanes philippinensis TaxID=35752 RepID=A0A1I2I986_9ACTN|nr:ABC transporter substrate-binding protein [Actinoplanes philippinensis]GIE78460.1 ABC transporter substrate-binding protein [Actinoplanes philippinensis]SFF38939.1 peptide/nickel transport system substrate-binding protein [Actinoplanes philippinensis]